MNLPRNSLLWSAAALLLFLLPAWPSLAEDEGQLWTELGLRYRALKWLELGFDQHLRLDEDMSELQSVMPEFKLQFRPSKYFRLGAGYRYIHERSKSGDFERAQRLHVDATARIRFDWLRLDYRLRFQETFEEGEYRSTVRNRLRLRFSLLDELTPFGAAELFNRFGDEDGFRTSKLRLTAGTALRLGDHNMDLFYRCELPVDDSDETRLHILGLGYHFDIP